MVLTCAREMPLCQLPKCYICFKWFKQMCVEARRSVVSWTSSSLCHVQLWKGWSLVPSEL